MPYTAYYGQVEDPADDNLEPDSEVLEENGIEFEVEDATRDLLGHEIDGGRALVFDSEEDAKSAAEYVYVTDEDGNAVAGESSLRW